MITACAALMLGAANPEPVVVRVATYNIEDARAEEIANPANPRLRAIAGVIQRLRPNVLLLNEIAYDMPGAPGFKEGEAPGSNARRFVENFLSVSQGPGLEPLTFEVFVAPSNTGVPSGLDLDNSGDVVTTFPILGPGERPTRDALAYAGDCWGFGTFPGQYAMALLVDPRLSIDRDRARTFRRFPWDYMPGALLPRTPSTDGSPEVPWFSEEELSVARLSSKSHWDVPVRFPNGGVVHFLCSHPTPPVFDGPEKRNARRNHDEIRFWADYVSNAGYFVDDANVEGPLEADAPFVILGDLNADPDEGDSYKDPIGILLSCRWVGSDVVPRAPEPGLDDDDTARFGLRVDYVLPSRSLTPRRSGIVRDASNPSDHAPVWIEVEVPGP